MTFALLAVSIGGCAVIAGGLEEGRPRPTAPDTPDATTDAAPEGSAPCQSDWPSGAIRRAVFEVTSIYTSTITDYTLPLYLDTHLLIMRGLMRPDGADVHVTAGDGAPRRVLLPPAVDSEAAKLWVRHDVPPGRTPIYVSFGGEPDLDAARHRDVFFDGIVPPLDPTSGAWQSNTKLSTMADGGATPRVRFGPTDPSVAASWCTTLALPEGHEWQILFDLRPGVSTIGSKYLVRVDNTAYFFASEAHPLDDAFTTTGIEPGASRALCFRVELPDREPREGDEASATFRAPRLRVHVPYPPKSILSRIEAAPCAP